MSLQGSKRKLDKIERLEQAQQSKILLVHYVEENKTYQNGVLVSNDLLDHPGAVVLKVVYDGPMAFDTPSSEPVEQEQRPDALPLLEAEARERQREAGEQFGRGQNSLGKDLPKLSPDDNKATQRAAEPETIDPEPDEPDDPPRAGVGLADDDPGEDEPEQVRYGTWPPKVRRRRWRVILD